MAKIDKQFEAIAQGFQNPQVSLYQTWIEDKQMEAIHVRRKQRGATHHKVWCLSVGEAGQNPTAAFYGHKANDCLNQALTWRGIAKTKRGPRAPRTQATAQSSNPASPTAPAPATAQPAA